MNKEKQIQTILVIVLAFLLLYFFKRKDIFLILGLLLGIAGLLIPAAARGIYICWSKLSEVLAWISGNVLLTIVFVLFLIPLAFFARRFNRLNIRFKRSNGSYFKERNHAYVKDDLLNPW
jgi:hypothetical protein